MNNRTAWVDYAKAIGIVLVVYGHVIRGLLTADLIPVEAHYRHELIDSIIYSFHMPLFFFLSGLFFYQALNSRGPQKVLFSKVDTIVYPFLLWSILQGSIEVVLSRYTNGSLTFSEVFSLLWHPRAQFWFLYALFMVFCLALLLYRRQRPAMFLPMFALGCLLYLLQTHVPEQGNLLFLVQNFVFFALGVWFNQFKVLLEERPGLWTLATSALFATFAYKFHMALAMRYDDRGVLSLLLAINGIFMIISLSMWLARRPQRWVLALGTASMHIYLMHILTGSGVRVVMSKFLGIHNVSLHVAVGLAAGILLPIIAMHIASRLNLNFLFEPPARLSLSRRARKLPEVPPPLPT